MHFSTRTLIGATAALAAAQSTTTSAPAATHTVTVGAKGNTFEPHNITAKVGDSVAFTFTSSSSHDVLQAEYARPCEARDPSALFSGDLSSRTANDQYIIKINDTNPIWYFCSVARHCQDGMVGVINPPQEVSEGGYTIEGWVAESRKTTASNNTFVAKAQGGSFASSAKKGGSGDANATTTEGPPAATSSGAAAGNLVAQGGAVMGLGAFVAALML